MYNFLDVVKIKSIVFESKEKIAGKVNVFVITYPGQSNKELQPIINGLKDEEKIITFLLYFLVFVDQTTMFASFNSIRNACLAPSVTVTVTNN